MTTSNSESLATNDRSGARLHRSATDRFCCGVCGGIAEYLSVDASLVRIAFVVATLWGGLGLLLYIVLAIILPVDNAEPATTSVSAQRSSTIAGLVPRTASQPRKSG